MSPFRIKVSSAERTELEATARRYSSSCRDGIRAKIILDAAQRLSKDVIAARRDTPRQIVGKLRKRFFQERLRRPDEVPLGGRPAAPTTWDGGKGQPATLVYPERLGLSTRLEVRGPRGPQSVR